MQTSNAMRPTSVEIKDLSENLIITNLTEYAMSYSAACRPDRGNSPDLPISPPNMHLNPQICISVCNESAIMERYNEILLIAP